MGVGSPVVRVTGPFPDYHRPVQEWDAAAERAASDLLAKLAVPEADGYVIVYQSPGIAAVDPIYD